MAVVIAVASAVAAATITALIVFQLTQGLPFWLAELLATVVAAVVWMLVGLKIAPRHQAVGPLLFAAGTIAAWYATRGVVHSISPYFGLVALEAAVLAASTAWAVSPQRAQPRWLRIVLPATAFVLVVASTLGTPTLGVVRQMFDATGAPKPAHIGFAGDSTYLWSRSGMTYTGPVRIELDPGSGAGEYRLHSVFDPEKIASLCLQFHASTDRMIATEVASGAIPAFVTRLPYRSADCEAGRLWQLEPIR